MSPAEHNAAELAAKGLRFCEPCRQILPLKVFRIRRGRHFPGNTRAAWCGTCELWHERVQRARRRLGLARTGHVSRRKLRRLLSFVRNISVEGVAA